MRYSKSRTGRPPGRPRTDIMGQNCCNISIKMTPEMHLAVIKAAKAQKISKSELIRKSLINLNLPKTEKTA